MLAIMMSCNTKSGKNLTYKWPDVKPPVCEKKSKELVAHGDTRIDNYYWLNEYFKKGDYTAARSYYTLVDSTNINYDEAQKKIIFCEAFKWNVQESCCTSGFQHGRNKCSSLCENIALIIHCYNFIG